MDPFERAFDLTIGIEGGYTDDPHDPGGRTRYGISQRAYPQEDIAALTLERAREIYRRDYWQAARCDFLPPQVAIQLFDCVVNHGINQGVRLFQRALGVADDGIIGTVTLRRANLVAPDRLARRLIAQRITHWTSLKHWPIYGRGWARRAATLLLEEA